MGVMQSPILMHSKGRAKRTPKLDAIRRAKKLPACMGESSPVVKGLAFVLWTCLSMSRSRKSLIMQPADLQVKAPTVIKLA